MTDDEKPKPVLGVISIRRKDEDPSRKWVDSVKGMVRGKKDLEHFQRSNGLLNLISKDLDPVVRMRVRWHVFNAIDLAKGDVDDEQAMVSIREFEKFVESLDPRHRNILATFRRLTGL